jgi:hypothetical protein
MGHHSCGDAVGWIDGVLLDFCWMIRPSERAVWRLCDRTAYSRVRLAHSLLQS